MGDTDLCPWDAGTFGSRTTPTMGPQLRAGAATAREALIDLAAQAGVSTARALDGGGRQGRRPGSEALALLRRAHAGREARSRRSPADVRRCTPPRTGRSRAARGRRSTAATSSPASTLHLRHHAPGHAARQGRCGRPRSRPRSPRRTRQRPKALPGVTVVRDGDFVGVAAPTVETAERAAAALKAEWNEDRRPALATRRSSSTSGRTPDAGARAGPRSRAPSSRALAAADVKLVADLHRRVHRPRAARAARRGRRVEGRQAHRLDRHAAPVRRARASWPSAFRIPAEKVRVIVPDTGSGYGGKHTGDAAVEAARLAKAAGKPVKVVWTREEEFTWAYFRPGGRHRRQGRRAQGRHARRPGSSTTTTPAPRRSARRTTSRTRRSSSIPSRRRCGRAPTAPWPPPPTTSPARAHMDELAHALGTRSARVPPEEPEGRAPQGRLRGRGRRSSAGARRRPAPAHGFGIAGGIEKGGYVATCAEVAVDPETRQRAHRAASSRPSSAAPSSTPTT